MTLQEMEKRMIEATLERNGGNIKESAAALGIEAEKGSFGCLLFFGSSVLGVKIAPCFFAPPP